MTRVSTEAVVVGAGVVGLAVARALSLAGCEVVLLERERAIGTGTSSRNSEVIHAGIYYPKGSLKALACVEGRDALYAYCAERGIAHARCGKLIVLPRGGDRARLDALLHRASANGVADIEMIDRDAVTRLEPSLETDGALLSPSTGVVDSHALMVSLRGDLEAAGGTLVLGAEVEGGDVSDGLVLQVGGDEPCEIAARHVVNCAGLDAVAFPARLAGFPARHLATAHYAKGSYFRYVGRPPFKRLVYPLPVSGGVGVHATLDLAGRIRFGPDVEWVEDPRDTAVDPARAKMFEADIRTYWPGLLESRLEPDYAGVRPKLVGQGAGDADFLLQDATVHGVPGLINMLGIESPGLTACLALGRRVADMIAAERTRP